MRRVLAKIFKWNIIFLLLINVLIFFPPNWELTFSSYNLTIRFGHGASYEKFYSSKVAVFGCDSSIEITDKEYWPKKLLGSTRTVIPSEIVTFGIALLFEIDLGPWKWTYNKL